MSKEALTIETKDPMENLRSALFVGSQNN